MINLEHIKNIIFDLGGVLLNIDYHLTKQAFIDFGVIDFDDYYNKSQQTDLFNLFEIGQITEHEFCDELRQLSNTNLSNQKIIAAWNSMLLDFPLIRKELLIQLKNSYRISLLSNTNETHIRAFNKTIQKDIQESSLAPLFHSHYFSNEIGYRKPNTDIFEYVLKLNDYKPSETLFLDDSIQHIEGAKKCGINTLHIKGIPVEKLFADFLT